MSTRRQHSAGAGAGNEQRNLTLQLMKVIYKHSGRSETVFALSVKCAGKYCVLFYLSDNLLLLRLHM